MRVFGKRTIVSYREGVSELSGAVELSVSGTQPTRNGSQEVVGPKSQPRCETTKEGKGFHVSLPTHLTRRSPIERNETKAKESRGAMG